MLQEQLDGQIRLVQLDPLRGQTFSVRKRDGRITPFDETRIHLAIEYAFKADAGINQDQPLPAAAQNNAAILHLRDAVSILSGLSIVNRFVRGHLRARICVTLFGSRLAYSFARPIASKKFAIATGKAKPLRLN